MMLVNVRFLCYYFARVCFFVLITVFYYIPSQIQTNQLLRRLLHSPGGAHKTSAPAPRPEHSAALPKGRTPPSEACLTSNTVSMEPIWLLDVAVSYQLKLWFHINTINTNRVGRQRMHLAGGTGSAHGRHWSGSWTPD